MSLASVILCCENSADKENIKRAVEAFNDQDWPHRELIIVSSEPIYGHYGHTSFLAGARDLEALIRRGVSEAKGEFCIVWFPQFAYHTDAIRVQINGSDYKNVVTMCQSEEHVSFSFARRNADRLNGDALGRRYVDSGHSLFRGDPPPASKSTPPTLDGFGEYGALNVMLPAGIGDVLWVLAKFSALAKEREIVFWIPDGEQHRSGGLCRMAGVDYGYLPTLTTPWVWDQPGSPALPGSGWVAVQANRHLEAGKHLKDWYPELPLQYPELNTFYRPPKADYVIGFTCLANYMGGQHQPKVWAEIFNYIHENVAPVMIVGAGKDVPFAREVMKHYRSPIPPLFDRPLEEVIPTVLASKAVVGVASGLLITSIVYGKPSLIAYPRWLAKMPGTWEPPSSKWSWCFTEDLPEKVKSGEVQRLLQ
jgi:hypothetical protein